MTQEIKKPSNPRMHNPDGVYASEARLEDYVTLRDYFANSAMQSLFANSTMVDKINEYTIELTAKDAYLIADEMLKQREL